MRKFLVESALLTHGLVSVSQEELRSLWPTEIDCITWVDQGQVVIGSMEQFLPFRQRAAELCRISWEDLPGALEKGVSGALTASGTMAVCQQMGLPLAVPGSACSAGHPCGADLHLP